MSEARPYIWANRAFLKIIYKYTQTNTNLKYGQPLEPRRQECGFAGNPTPSASCRDLARIYTYLKIWRERMSESYKLSEIYYLYNGEGTSQSTSVSHKNFHFLEKYLLVRFKL